jgi:hypothetical protein
MKLEAFKLTSGIHNQFTSEGFWHWCPGCKMTHAIYTAHHQHPGGPDQSRKPTWSFNGDDHAPTFGPSVRHDWGMINEKPKLCHYFIRNGLIEFCGDSTHELAGKTVALPEIPKEELIG